MSKVPVTEVYVVLTVSGELEDARDQIVAMLDYAAEQFERIGYRGGTTGFEDDDVAELEIMVVDSVEAALRAGDVDEALGVMVVGLDDETEN